ncbi:uncharacterized protein LOC62_07G008961 [Vanrija pseudolonga]|uniref:Uncharacterized protein n=1 Tax=Vanrija pseudolonga TaxID=143232 RepID=A0AAF0YFL3_9TREE|nr:hypothetical protein LOC62_07G008961 [Vanrija pseudolonga]
MSGFDVSSYPHILTTILSHVSFDTLPALRGVNKRIGKWAESQLYKHVVVQVSKQGRIDLLDPYLHRPMAGLRFAPTFDDTQPPIRGQPALIRLISLHWPPGDEHAHRPTLRRLATHTTTFDFIGHFHFHFLQGPKGWADIRDIASAKRVRYIDPICHMFKKPPTWFGIILSCSTPTPCSSTSPSTPTYSTPSSHTSHGPPPPALRATNKELAKFANATLWNHLAVAPHGPVLAVTDPYTRRRVPGMRLEGAHTGPTLRLIAQQTATVDLVGHADALHKHPLWLHFRRLAETKRIRCTQAISDLLLQPTEVVLHFDVDVSRLSPTTQPSPRFKRLLAFVSINDALVAPRLRAHEAGFKAAASVLSRSDELVLVFVPGAQEPDIDYWRRNLQPSPVSHLHYRAFELVLGKSITPSFELERSATFVGMETSIHTRLVVKMDTTSSEAQRLEHLRREMDALIQRSKDRLGPSVYPDVYPEIKVRVEALSTYPRSAGYSDYEWAVVMTKPGVKLPSLPRGQLSASRAEPAPGASISAMSCMPPLLDVSHRGLNCPLLPSTTSTTRQAEPRRHAATPTRTADRRPTPASRD